MAAVRPSDGGDFRRVPGSGEPIVNGCADRASADRRLTRALMSGDEQQDALAPRNRLLERSVDCAPRAVEAHAVEVDGPIRLDRAAADASVPCSVESCTFEILPGTGRGTATRRGVVERAWWRAPNPLHRLRRFPSPSGGG